MALRQYEGPGQVQIGGRTLAEAESISWNVAANNNRVYTMRKGLAGKSDGARESDVSVENAVPKAGLEDTFVEQCIEGASVRLVVLLAGKRYTFNGWIEEVSARQSVSERAMISFSVVARPPDIG